MTSELQLVPRDQAIAPFHVGVDLGGTNIKVGVVDDHGQPIHRFSIPTEPQHGAEDGARRMGEAVLRALGDAGVEKSDVGGVGLGSPGTMDVPAGLLLRPHNLPGWVDFPIRDRVSQHCGFPVTFANDANAAAYGEFWVGRGKDLNSMILLTLGTGVGGGIIISGSTASSIDGTRQQRHLVINGETSHGGECGHIIIDYNDTARMCPCGQRGHLEAYASATAVIERMKEAAPRRPESSVGRRMKAGEAATPLLLNEEAERGDALALELILETAMYLGVGITSLVHTIDPQGVVLGGAMTFDGHDSAIGRQFLQRVTEEVRRRAFPTPASKLTIDFAMLGNDAGYIGAAGLARLEQQRG